ncbi:MAG: DUF2271 domain-containing protein [Alphaproteobacteria bacterium]|nr:DUF2271 domain-containing protein [Alphaproteobacteria bacterium]
MLMATAFFSFFVNLLQLVAPLFMLQVYDRVLQSRSGETLVALVVIAIVLLIVMGLLEAIRSRVLVRMGGKIDQLIGGRLLQAVLEVTNRTGRGQEAQVLRDLETLRGFMTTSGIFALFDSPWVPIFLFVMFLFHPMIGAVGVVGAIVLFSLALATEMRTRDPLKLASFHASRANDFAETSRRNAEVVQSLGMIGGVRRKWQVMHDTALNLQAIASDRAGSITGATRAPGAHKVAFSRAQLGAAAPGQYVLVIEAAREVGGRELLRIPFSWPAKAGAGGRAAGTTELGAVSVSFR